MNLIFFCCRPTRHSRLYLQANLLMPLRQNVLKKIGWTFFSLFDFVVQNILWSDDAGANDLSTTLMEIELGFVGLCQKKMEYHAFGVAVKPRYYAQNYARLELCQTKMTPPSYPPHRPVSNYSFEHLMRINLHLMSQIYVFLLSLK